MAAKKKSEPANEATLRIEYYRSAIGSTPKHKLIIKGLGFKRLNQVVTRVDTPAVRGMVAKAPHLVRIL
ncbi:MAG: 50S ribosomal protein L30 [Acidobacteriota bacterium]|jgi:large subunit ribosomal protein L30|nr:50S ribosomal protein L30 [Acidobacteriota bacterium]